MFRRRATTGRRHPLAEGLTRGPRRLRHAAAPARGLRVPRRLGRRIGDPVSGWIATVAVGGSFVVACIVLAALLGRPADHRMVGDNNFTWIPVDGLPVNFGHLLDPLSMTMCLFVTGVSALIHLYSIGYMKGDRATRVLFLPEPVPVLHDRAGPRGQLPVQLRRLGGRGLLLLRAGRLLVRARAAASAAKKAFVTNRIGDFGFMIALFLMFGHSGSFNYSSGPGGGIFGQLAAPGRQHRHGRRAPAVPGRRRASRPRSPCTCGCPTPWRAPRRCRPSSTPPPWSRPAST